MIEFLALIGVSAIIFVVGNALSVNYENNRLNGKFDKSDKEKIEQERRERLFDDYE